MLKSAYANPEYRRIAQLARPYYEYDGPNSWQHIQEVRRRAAKMVRRLAGRQLSPAEYAAIMFHDSTKRDFGGKHHAEMGAERAAQVLAAAMHEHDLAEATEAIAAHDSNLAKFPSRTAELLASADANPPDLDWVLNKSYNWNIKHGLKGEDRYRYLLETLPGKYGTGGTFNYPGIYSRYYGDKVGRYRKALDNLTVDEARRRLGAYRARYGIGPDETRVIHNR